MADLKNLKGISAEDKKLLAQAEEWMGLEPAKMGPVKNIFWGNLKEEFYFPYPTQDAREQAECDPIIEDVEVTLNTLREELHLYAQKKGDMVGDIVLVDRGDEIDCARMGSGGYGIPSIVEPDVIQFKKHDAKFILHVEKDTVWQRFNEDKFWRKHKCILTHGGGQPPRGVRRLLNRLHNELGVSVLTNEGEPNLLGGESPDAPGLDLLALANGSEGKLYVVTDVTLNLLPKPQCSRVIMAGA